MSRRIYVAARLAAADEAAALASVLRREGHRVTSTWHDTRREGIADHDVTRAERRAICKANHGDLAAADTLLALAHPDCRGTLVEIGVAWFRGVDVCIVGDPFDITPMVDFPGVRWFATADDARAYLRRAQGRAA